MPSPSDIQASAPQMRGMFTRIAGMYDRLNRVQSLGLDVLWRRRALARLAGEVPSPRTILDLATGTADFAIAAARHFPGAHVTGVDLTPAMLDVGRSKVEAAGLAGRVSLEVGDACALACADASADVAICAFGFRNFPDRVRTLREVVRVLAAGGHLLVLELFRPRFRVLAAGGLRLPAGVNRRDVHGGGVRATRDCGRFGSRVEKIFLSGLLVSPFPQKYGKIVA